MLEVLTSEMPAVDPHHPRTTGSRTEYIHQEFDKGCFARAIGANQSVDSPLRHTEVDVVDGGRRAKLLGEILCTDHVAHRSLRPPSLGLLSASPLLRRCQCAEIEVSISSLPIPRR